MHPRTLASSVLAAVTLAFASVHIAHATDDEAAALLAKHAAFAGWRGGDGSIKTLREIGEATRDGKTLLRFDRLQIGSIYRSTLATAGGSFENGFTGRIFWQSNENGFTTPDNGDVVRYLATNAQIDDEELTALPGTLRGSETVDGVATRIVRVVAQAGLPVDLSIDPNDGELKRIVIDPDGTFDERVDVLATTDVGSGKRVISAWRYAGGHTTYTYTKIEANTTIANDELHPPKPTATWTFGPVTQTVPIDVGDKRITLEAVVNGHRGRFLFDTGAGVIALTDSFARAAGATRVGRTEMRGIGGSARANVYRVDSLAVGPNTLHDVRVVTGLDERGGGLDPVDGLIGFDLLAGAIVDMDLDAKTLRILDPATLAPDQSQGIMLHVDLSSGQPRLAMTIGGNAAVRATLDSGDDFYALFAAQLVSRSHVRFFSPPDSLASRIAFSGANGHEVDTCGRLESLELGPIVYRPVPACMSDSMAGNEVVVGFDFFKNLNYVFDYPDGEILVSARKTR